MTDTEQFGEFVRARWTATMRLAYALTLDHATAEDLAQESFAKLWFRWSKVRDGNPEAYLRRIVVNTLISSKRRRWSGEVPTGELPEPTISSTSSATVATVNEGGATRVDDRDMLRRAMARLSGRQRAVVFLRYAEDMSEKDVAELLGCSVGAVKQYASRGLAALRQARGLSVFSSAERQENHV